MWLIIKICHQFCVTVDRKQFPKNPEYWSYVLLSLTPKGENWELGSFSWSYWCVNLGEKLICEKGRSFPLPFSEAVLGFALYLQFLLVLLQLFGWVLRLFIYIYVWLWEREIICTAVLVESKLPSSTWEFLLLEVEMFHWYSSIVIVKL